MDDDSRARLCVIVARAAPLAVIFRRGPSKLVRLIRWHTDTDVFEHGQWFRGRIYERRCDLSPDGKYLLYFAASWKLPLSSWTAISRPPFLTALALWRNGGAWGGGGLFADERTILLNHGRCHAHGLETEVGSVPDAVRVLPLGECAGSGEDAPVWYARLEREGWRCVQDGAEREPPAGGSGGFTLSPPQIYERAHPMPHVEYCLQWRLHGIGHQGGPWYVNEFVLVNSKPLEVSLGQADWADWDRSGDLLLAREACLYRAKLRTGTESVGELVKIADFGADTFSLVHAPPAARMW